MHLSAVIDFPLRHGIVKWNGLQHAEKFFSPAETIYSSGGVYGASQQLLCARLTLPKNFTHLIVQGIGCWEMIRMAYLCGTWPACLEVKIKSIAKPQASWCHAAGEPRPGDWSTKIGSTIKQAMLRDWNGWHACIHARGDDVSSKSHPFTYTTGKLKRSGIRREMLPHGYPQRFGRFVLLRGADTRSPCSPYIRAPSDYQLHGGRKDGYICRFPAN